MKKILVALFFSSLSLHASDQYTTRVKELIISGAVTYLKENMPNARLNTEKFSPIISGFLSRVHQDIETCTVDTAIDEDTGAVLLNIVLMYKTQNIFETLSNNGSLPAGTCLFIPLKEIVQ